MKTSVSVVIPVFNTVSVLPLLAERIDASLSGTTSAFEVIMVDDCSHDGSWNAITSLAKRYPWLAGLRLSHNQGQYAATLAGLRYARYPVAVTMDDDLQHPPEAIPLLLDALTPGISLVYGAPHIAWAQLPYRMAVALTKAITALACRAPFLSHMRSFRAMHTSLYPWAKLPPDMKLSPDGLLTPLKPKVRVVRVAYGQRLSGHSTYTWKLSVQLLAMILRSARMAYPPQGNQPPRLSDVTGWLAQSQYQIAVGAR